MNIKIKDNNNNFSELLLPVVYDYMDKQSRVFSFEDKRQLKNKLENIKKNSLNNIEELKQQAVANLRKNGFKVFEAKTKKQAQDYIANIVKNDNLIVKAKTNTANEIELRQALIGKKLLETDIGDFLATLAEQKEIHPVLPAINMTAQEIADLIKQKFDIDVPAVPEKIVEFVRLLLRKKIYNADTAITGANVITKDGQVVILENEGNISLITRIPEKHIIISGFEKIVPTIEDAMHVVKCSAVWGTGQNFPAYVNIISGPSKTADIQNQIVEGAQGAKEVYVILIDNGRSELIEKGYTELLHCINCGACLNFCPAYHNFADSTDSKYMGIAKIIKDAHKIGLESVKQVSSLCTLCHSCQVNCPANIDAPKLMKKLRQELQQNNLDTQANKKMVSNIRQFGNPFGDVKVGDKPSDLYCC